MIRTLFLAGSALALASCASNMDYGNMNSPMAGRAPMGAPGMNDPTPTAAMPYSVKAAASDLFEIQSSQIALQKSQNPNVRQFAQMLISHHTQTTATLMAAARSAGMTPPPPMLEPMQADMISQLQGAPAGPGFDKLFVSQQIPAHQMALALHQTYAGRGDVPALRTAAASAVPIVQQHLVEAQRMNGMM